MSRNITSILIAFIAGLAIVGFFTMLIKNPGRLLVSILVMIGIAFVIYFVFRAIMNRNGSGGGNNKEMRKYRQAVKQSNKKYKTQPKKIQQRNSKPQTLRSLKRRRKNVPYLKVIDGKKSTNKEDDRASN